LRKQQGVAVPPHSSELVQQKLLPIEEMLAILDESLRTLDLIKTSNGFYDQSRSYMPDGVIENNRSKARLMRKPPTGK
jgi:hypothetical protein